MILMLNIVLFFFHVCLFGGILDDADWVNIFEIGKLLAIYPN